MSARRDAFAGYHPAVNALFFALVLGFSMFLTHPAALAVSLFAAARYAGALDGRGAWRSLRRLIVPLVLLSAAVNPLFSHEGVTILRYLPNGNPLTLESILYGAGAGALLAAVLLWFRACSAVMTADKLVALFGAVAPSLALLLSMALRLVPRFRAQLRQVRDAQRARGRGAAASTRVRRARDGVSAVSILITWALEDAMETADSMKSRGYGLPGRTAYSPCRMEARDWAVLAWLAFCGFYLAAGALAGGLRWRYYPSVRGAGAGVWSASFLLVYLLLCLTPEILNRSEARRWRSMKSNT